MRAIGVPGRSALVALAGARGHLLPFAPVFLGIGIGLWFALPWEPDVAIYGGLAGLAALCLILRLVGPELAHPLALALFWLTLGVLAAGGRAHMQAAPVLGFRYYGPVEGRIIEVDRSQSDKLRVTLDRVRMERMDPAETPLTVRISIHRDYPGRRLEPGLFVMVTANMSPPPPPAEPGGFDFRRIAWFERLGAVGYTRTPVLAVAPADPHTQYVNRLRAHLSAIVQRHIPGQAGAFASGSVTGDRSGITLDTVEDLRRSNLSHLLAISGMNLAFLVAFVFALVRYGMALVPPLVLRVDSKKVAAVVALGVAGFYLALSGGNVATERAFLMVAVMLGAVLIDKRAISIRSVAIAALILLLAKPEELLNAGFQMSMAATLVLVAGFGALNAQVMRGTLPRWTLPLFAAVISTALAGIATAPFGAAHFNRFTDYGFLANLLTVPTMGVFIMPGAVIAFLLAPIGLGAPGYWMMEFGARWILAVAHWIAGWEGSITGIPAPSPAVLPLMVLGTLWAILWRGPARFAGAVPVVFGLVLWATTERPPLLISSDAALTGVMGPAGRALSHERGAGFAAENWLERDGDLGSQEVAARRPGIVRDGVVRRMRVGDGTVVHLKGRGAVDRLEEACATADLVILAGDKDVAAPAGCLMLDRRRLEAMGGTAVWPGSAGGLRIVPATSARRLWSGAERPAAEPEPVLVAAQ